MILITIFAKSPDLLTTILLSNSTILLQAVFHQEFSQIKSSREAFILGIRATTHFPQQASTSRHHKLSQGGSMLCLKICAGFSHKHSHDQLRTDMDIVFQKYMQNNRVSVWSLFTRPDGSSGSSCYVWQCYLARYTATASTAI